MLEITAVLSDNLRRLRKATGKSQGDFAQSIGMPFRTYQNIEMGLSWPELANLKAIARGLGVDTVRLFNAPATPTPQQALDVLSGLIAPLAALDQRELAALIAMVRESSRDLIDKSPGTDDSSQESG